MRSKLKFSEDISIWLLNFAFNFFLNKNFQPIMHRNGVALYSSQAFHHSPTTSSLWGLLLSICFGTKVSFFSCKQYLATLSSLGCPPYLSSLSFSPKLYIPSAIKLKYTHTIYTRNNMRQKCEGICGLWVLNEILKKTYPENLKKILGAVWELPAK